MQHTDARERLAFALDVSSREEAVRWASELKNEVGVFKIGLELFLSQGPAIVKEVQNAAPESAIFLDLKLHDIPETVGRAAAAVAPLLSSSKKPGFLTVHAADGEEIVRAAVERAPGVRILAITVLTSVERTEDTRSIALSRAHIAANAGCAGVVSSGEEVKALKETFGTKLLLVTPGIRPASGAIPKDDQRRVSTPREAIRAGADLLVVGRPIRNAPNPVQAARAIVEEIASALE